MKIKKSVIASIITASIISVNPSIINGYYEKVYDDVLSANMNKLDYELKLNPIEKIVNEGEVVTITYSFKEINNIISEKDFYVCIDIPKKLELVEFRINENIVNSGISSLDPNYNRIYLPIKYEGDEIKITYDVKITPDFKPNSKIFISHAIRDAASGNHINVPWTKCYLIRLPLVEDGTNEDNNQVTPDDEIVNPPIELG